MRPTERRFLHSTLAAYGSQLARVVIRIAGDLLLARLLLPERYGLFDLAFGIVLIAGIFRDLGLPYQLVRDERKPYGTVFLWTTGAGLALTLGLALGAPLFAGLDAGLPEVLRVYSLFVLLDGLAVVPKEFYERELEVGRLVVPEILRGLIMAAVSITLAVLGFGVWSLVAGQLAGAALFAAMLWYRAHGRMPLDFQPALIPDLVGRSMTLFFIALMALPVPYVSRFVIGGVIPGSLGISLLAQYGKAREWGFRLQELVQPAVARVLYPALVAYRGERERFFGAYRIGTLSILALETLAAYFLFFNAEVVLLKILIGPQWAAAVPILKILCFVPLLDPFSRLGGEVLKTEGEDRAWLVAVVLNFVSLVGFGIVLTRMLGVEGMAWASYLLLGNWLLAWRVWRICGAEFWKLTRDLLFVYLLPLPLFLGVAWLFPAESWTRLGVSIAAGAVAGGIYLLRFRRPFREFFLGRREVP
jgi:O-antigen/teichoic acid export membrane protein